MKRFLWLILLLSLGLNLGLGWRLYSRSEERGRGPGGPPFGRGERSRQGGSDFRQGGRPSPADTTAWRRIMDERLERMAARLELDERQRAVFRQAQQNAFLDFETLRQRVEQAQQELFRLTAAEQLDPDAVRSAVTEVRLFRSGLDSLVTETVLAEMAVLTPEQRREYLDIIPWVKLGGGPDRPGGPGGRRGHGGHRAPERRGIPGPDGRRPGQ